MVTVLDDAAGVLSIPMPQHHGACGGDAQPALPPRWVNVLLSMDGSKLLSRGTCPCTGHYPLVT